LCRLSVFAGGCTLSAAEAVCSQGGLGAREVVEILGSLVNKSLVQAEPLGNDLRYRLLETVRQYVAEKLPLKGDAEAPSVRDAHAHLFLDLAETAAPHLRGADQAQWFDRLELEHDNLRAAMAHFLVEQSNVEQSLRIGVALKDFLVFPWLF
jgi:predicted ATPase